MPRSDCAACWPDSSAPILRPSMPTSGSRPRWAAACSWCGLRLFLSLATAGWVGHAAHIERAVAQTAWIRGELERRGWSIVNDSPFALLNVVPPATVGEPRAVVARVLASGRAWVSLARFEERDVIRICVTHGETSDADLAMLIETLDQH